MHSAPLPSLSIDGGQSGIRLRVRFASGRSEEHSAGALRTDRPVLPQVGAAVAALAGERGLRFGALAAGLSGLTGGATDPRALLAAVAPLGVTTVALAHDSVTGFLAANGLAEGAVAAVGTGVVVLGVGPAGAVRVDGWGHLVGDAGSAWWIGREGIDAALRAFDGRGATTSLQDAVRARFGDPSELYMTLQADPGRVATIAAFATRVGAEAEAGDPVALAVLLRAAAELVSSLSAALTRAGHAADDPVRVSWVGRVLTANAIVRDEVRRLLMGAAPGATLVPPLGEPLDGVERLLDLPSDHALAATVPRAAS